MQVGVDGVDGAGGWSSIMFGELHVAHGDPETSGMGLHLTGTVKRVHQAVTPTIWQLCHLAVV